MHLLGHVWPFEICILYEICLLCHIPYPLWRFFGLVDAHLKSFCVQCNLTPGLLECSRSTSWGRKSRFCQLHWSHRPSEGSN